MDGQRGEGIDEWMSRWTDRKTDGWMKMEID